jgi:hypothetical protein
VASDITSEFIAASRGHPGPTVHASLQDSGQAGFKADYRRYSDIASAWSMAVRQWMAEACLSCREHNKWLALSPNRQAISPHHEMKPMTGADVPTGNRFLDSARRLRTSSNATDCAIAFATSSMRANAAMVAKIATGEERRNVRAEDFRGHHDWWMIGVRTIAMCALVWP